MVEIIVDIFENNSRTAVVTHVFRGRDIDEAMSVERAHQKTDSFYRAAINNGKFNGIKLSFKSYIRGAK